MGLWSAGVECKNLATSCGPSRRERLCGYTQRASSSPQSSSFTLKRADQCFSQLLRCAVTLMSPPFNLARIWGSESAGSPLIMILQFVGFMAAYRDPGALSPMLAGTLSGLLATWVTFIPCFLWIFLGRRSSRFCATTRLSAARFQRSGSGGSGPQSRDLVCAAYDISRGPAGARVPQQLVQDGGQS